MNKVTRVNDKELIISRDPSEYRKGYITFWISLVTGILFLLFLFIYSIIFAAILLILIVKYRHRLPISTILRPVIIRKEGNLLYVNKKAFVPEELIFLSFHQTERYRVIRLEARRKNILFPNEAWLLSNCSGFEEALSVCREIREFIDPTLKINHFRLVSGKSRERRMGNDRSRQFEHWEFIE